MQILPLQACHAAEAARLHITGQPGTFLTKLGPDVLRVLYQALPQSTVGFGYVAHSSDSATVAFISATTSISRLFLELGTRRLTQFLPSLTKRFAQQPTLIFQSIQTVLYPFLVRDESSREYRQADHPTAELLSIMVEPELRSQGIGTQLLDALLTDCRQRQIALLDVTVDAKNQGARHFYERHGFEEHRRFTLYGREMCLYQLTIGD